MCTCTNVLTEYPDVRIRTHIRAGRVATRSHTPWHTHTRTQNAALPCLAQSPACSLAPGSLSLGFAQNRKAGGSGLVLTWELGWPPGSRALSLVLGVIAAATGSRPLPDRRDVNQSPHARPLPPRGRPVSARTQGSWEGRKAFLGFN